MDKHDERQYAIELLNKGKTVIEVSVQLSRSRKWVYHWLKAYRSGRKDWFKDRDKAPKTIPHKLSDELEGKIVEIRKRLEDTLYAQIGAMGIIYELAQIGITGIETWQINRVLKRNGLVKKTRRYQSKKKNTPSYSYPFNKWT